MKRKPKEKKTRKNTQNSGTPDQETHLQENHPCHKSNPKNANSTQNVRTRKVKPRADKRKGIHAGNMRS